MKRATPFAALGAVAAIVAGSACGGDDVGEAILEQAIENESGDEVDLDLDGLFDEDGDFSMAVDVDGDGEPDSIEFDVDEDGNFTVDGDFDGDGEIDTVEFDSDGDGGGTMTFDDIDGESGSIEIDVADDGDGDSSMTIETENGESGTFEVETDGDGNETVTIETGDGEESIEINSTDELPDDWPSEVPRPDGIDIDSVIDFGGDGVAEIFVSGSVEDGFAWFDDYVARLQAAGFEEQFAGRTDDGATGAYGDDSIGQTSISVTVTTDAAPGSSGFFVSVGLLSG